MEQEEYNRAIANDQIVKAIEGISGILTGVQSSLDTELLALQQQNAKTVASIDAKTGDIRSAVKSIKDQIQLIVELQQQVPTELSANSAKLDALGSKLDAILQINGQVVEAISAQTESINASIATAIDTSNTMLELAIGDFLAKFNTANDDLQGMLVGFDDRLQSLQTILQAQLSMYTGQQDTGDLNDSAAAMQSSIDQQLRELNAKQNGATNVTMQAPTAMPTAMSNNTVDYIAMQFDDFLAKFNTANDDLQGMLVGFDDRLMSMQQPVVDALLPMQAALEQIRVNNEELNEKLEDSKTVEKKTNFLNASLNLLKFMVEKKNAKNFEGNAKGFAAGFDILMKPINALLDNYDKLEKGSEAFDKMTDLFDTMGRSVKKTASAIAVVVASMLAITAAIAFMDSSTITKFVVTFPILCTTMAAGLCIISKAADKKNLQGIHHFAAAVGILAISLLAFAVIDWPMIGKGVVAMTGLSVGLGLAMKLFPTKGIMQFGKSVFMLAAAVGVLAMTTAVIAMLIEATPWSALLKSMGVLLIAGGVLWLASHVISAGADKIGKAFGWLALGLAAFGLSLMLFQELIEDIKWETWALVGGSLLALTAAVHFIGKSKTTWEGVAMIGAIAGSIVALGYAATLYEQTTWETLGKIGASLTGLVTAIVVVGKAGKDVMLGAGAMMIAALAVGALGLALKAYEDADWEHFGFIQANIWAIGLAMAAAGAGAEFIALGAGSMILAAGAVAAIGFSLKAWNEDIQWEQLGFVAATMGAVGAEMALAGVGAAFIAAGSASMILAAGAVGAMGLAVKAWDAEIQWEKLGFIAATMGAIGAEMAIAGPLSPLIGLGSAAMILAGGAVAIMGPAVAKWPTKITDAQFTTMAFGIGKIGLAMAAIGNPLTYPFMMMGIASAKNLGMAIYEVGKGLMLAQKINFPLATKQATAIVKWAKDTLNITKASLKDVLKGPQNLKPYESLGRIVASLAIGIMTMANGTWKEYDAKGNVIAVHNIGPTEYAKFGDAVAQMVNAISEPIREFGAGGGFLRSSDAEKGMEAMSHIGDITGPMIDVAKSIEDLHKAGPAAYQLFGECVKSLVDNISTPLNELGKDSSWWYSSDFEKGAKILGKLKDSIQPVIDIAQQFDTWNKLSRAEFAEFGHKTDSMVTALGDAFGTLQIYEDEYDDGFDVLEDYVKPGLAIINGFVPIVQAYGKVTPNDLAMLSLSSDYLTTALADYAKADKLLPLSSRTALNIMTIGNATKMMNVPNLQLLVESARAIDSIANANLSSIRTAKSEVAKQLFEILEKLRLVLVKIEKNTKPRDIPTNALKFDSQTGKFTNEFRLENGMEVDLATIAMQLDSIYGLIAGQDRHQDETLFM